MLQIDDKSDNVIGLIPAAGFATRVASMLTCSKEIQPVTLSDGSSRVVSSFLLESLQQASAKKAYFVLRRGKWDIPEYFSNGFQSEMDLAYIVSEATQGVPFTIDKAFPFINESTVLLGFPDIIFSPTDAFQILLDKKKSLGADLVLGLFKTDKPQKADMVKFDADGNLSEIVIKPKETDLVYTWIMAAWTPVFTRFMHDYLDKHTVPYSGNESDKKSSELHIGDIVREAISAGLKTSHVTFESGKFLDIGTPSDLQKVSSQNWLTHFDSAPLWKYR